MPSIAIDPLPFAVALWARTAEMGVTTVFISMVFTASLMLEELASMADAMRKKMENSTKDELNDPSFSQKTDVLKYGNIILFVNFLKHRIPILET